MPLSVSDSARSFAQLTLPLARDMSDCPLLTAAHSNALAIHFLSNLPKSVQNEIRKTISGHDAQVVEMLGKS